MVKLSSVSPEGYTTDADVSPSTVHKDPKLAQSKERHDISGKKEHLRTKVASDLEEEEQGTQSLSSERRGAFRWTLPIIMPNDTWYLCFWYGIVVYALVTAFVEPLKMAYFPVQVSLQAHVFFAFMEISATLIFFLDIVFKFFLAYQDPDTKEIITSSRAIQLRYLSFLFWFDVVFMFPWAAVILSANPGLFNFQSYTTADMSSNANSMSSMSPMQPPLAPSTPAMAQPVESSTALYISLLGLLKLGRLYNLFDFFNRLDLSMVFDQVTMTILRNFTYVVISCHVFACIYFFNARVEEFKYDSWTGRNSYRFDGQPVSVQYLYSFYVSLLASAGLGDSDFYSNSPSESLIMSVFMMFSTILSAYILGTVTLMMVKGDKRSKVFRDRTMMLHQFSTYNQLPDELDTAMKQHLNLHYTNEHMSDAKVLAPYPSAITRRVLSHLYLEPIQQCSLFYNCKRKFLNAVMAACRTEMFMPNIQLLSEGDIVADLYMVISGEVIISSDGRGGDVSTRDGNRTLDPNGSVISIGNSSMNASALDSSKIFRGASNTSMRNPRGASSMVRGEKRGPSQCFGEVAFFTDTPQPDAVWTTSLVRVLVFPRRAYDGFINTFASNIRKMLTNLKRDCEKDLFTEIREAFELIPRTPNDLYSRLGHYMKEGVLTTIDLPTQEIEELRHLLSGNKLKHLERMQIINSSIAAFYAKMEAQSVIEFLDAASKGDEKTVKKLLKQGLSASCADYDKRTALMVAAQEGREDVLRILVQYKANVHALDIFGTNALVGAVRYNHPGSAAILLAAGCSLKDCTMTIKTDVIMSIVDKDIQKLTDYLSAGADPNMSDHAGSSLLHVAAGEGYLAAVELLVDFGADVLIEDRCNDAWGSMPIHVAKRMNVHEVVAYLEPLVHKALAARAEAQRQKMAEPTKGMLGGSNRYYMRPILVPSPSSRSEDEVVQL
ncbi:hypothetical protein CEUSTIGMA_g7796.t1 [Chlamydomonas eustigma]|uniref:Cyclic nucleotide-binding domain-containing protein n=1 Tax=Chlamydomonas eustigma TaxID=1157962 RepID=A0A250XB98_9CHLO|nr:hypothetical protein CEUSTIGMA_g7796.t1 [Chlamydomonas eustigma]|eukprot:GAX80357.1 hypothetical protein CEUSTIGMA_g7796.t1 [Chlamydomonas eustigma]